MAFEPEAIRQALTIRFEGLAYHSHTNTQMLSFFLVYSQCEVCRNMNIWISVFEVFSRYTIKLSWDPTAMVHKRICLQSLRRLRFACLLRLALRPDFLLDVTLLFLVSPSNLPLDILFGKTKAEADFFVELFSTNKSRSTWAEHGHEILKLMLVKPYQNA